MIEVRSRWLTTGALAFTLAVADCAGSDSDQLLPDPDPGETVQPLVAAPGIGLDRLALYQGIERPLMDGGQIASSEIPIVANRNALVRAFVSSDGSYTGPVTGRLYIGSGDAIEVTATLAGPSTQEDLATTLNFQVHGSRIDHDTTYRIEIGQLAEQKGAAPLTYPATDGDPIFVDSIGDKLRIALVPVRYNADGSGRVPDTSDEQVAAYKEAFAAMYPAPDVEITVHAPMDWSGNVSPNGSGWDSLLSALADLRMSEGAPPDLYYYGAFVPASSFGAFCNGGCVAGLGMTGGAGDSYARAAIGLGYPGAMSIETALHEVGHNHGRLHAPCQTFDSDPGYPYAGGKTSTWGYDRSKDALFPPTAADIMGYCSPVWISDYTFLGLLERIRVVNQAASAYVIGGKTETYDRVRIDADGVLHWMPPVDLPTAPAAEATAVTVESNGGAEALTGQLYAYDHLPGGVLFYKRPARDYRSVLIKLGSQVARLAR